ncbi:hypothetical protein [Listeria innocua]|uniref:hypothetical protein n=1 Tax=Listeria innocua TaxID=1642 RepID=UPI0021C8F199|nr:hypothetical protein [Listeria innocua]
MNSNNLKIKCIRYKTYIYYVGGIEVLYEADRKVVRQYVYSDDNEDEWENTILSLTHGDVSTLMNDAGKIVA